jgi:hypothetical protein
MNNTNESGSETKSLPHIPPFIEENEQGGVEKEKPQFELRLNDGTLVSMMEEPEKMVELKFVNGERRKVLESRSHPAKVDVRYESGKEFEVDGQNFRVIKGPLSPSDKEKFPTALWVERLLK